MEGTTRISRTLDVFRRNACALYEISHGENREITANDELMRRAGMENLSNIV